jgi:predicted enzyme related to lactoylglutathione lyase
VDPGAHILDRLIAYSGAPHCAARHRAGSLLDKGIIMPERTSYAQGTPNWVDLPTTDQDAAKTFYAGVFGWTYDDQPMGEGAVYSMAKLRGHDVAAISPQPPEMAAAGAPPMWNTYIAVESADDAAAKIAAAGGKVGMEPFDVMDAGRMVFAMDPGGVPVAFWQPNQHIGASLVNEPGTVTWNELITTDPSSAKFYEQVAGMTTSTMDMGQGEYTLFMVGDQMVGGTTPPQMPGTPNHWHVYFAVDDADATAAKITELGGTILVPPFDTPVGRMVVAQDPQGAVFSIMKPAPQPE